MIRTTIQRTTDVENQLARKRMVSACLHGEKNKPTRPAANEINMLLAASAAAKPNINPRTRLQITQRAFKCNQAIDKSTNELLLPFFFSFPTC